MDLQLGNNRKEMGWGREEKKAGDAVQIRANLYCRELNEYFYQTHEPIPTSDELRHKLQGRNKFSTLDMINSFLQFVLEPRQESCLHLEHQEVCTDTRG